MTLEKTDDGACAFLMAPVVYVHETGVRALIEPGLIHIYERGEKL